jgi:hypothetical protein
MHPQTEKLISSKGGLIIDNQRKPDADDDIEEGVNLANTQKIPMSLIKQ